MKKWILCILFSMNAYANDLSLVEQWKDIHKIEWEFTPFISLQEPLVLIEKIESTESETRKEILKVLLELNFENLEKFLNYSIEDHKKEILFCKKSIESSNHADDIKRKLKDIENMQISILNSEKSLEIIHEWKVKYLSPKSEELRKGE